MHWSLYAEGKSLRYTLEKSIGWPHCRSGRGAENKITLSLAGNRNQTEDTDQSLYCLSDSNF